MITHSLFSTAVGRFNIGRIFTEEELNFINQLEKVQNMGNFSSKNNHIFEHKIVGDLAKLCKGFVDQYIEEIYAPKKEVEMRMTQSWANYTEPGQFHHRHEHPNSFVSGVLYINADPTKDKIYFYKNQYQQIILPTENFNHYNSHSWWFEVGTGDVIIFPSGLTHMVQTVETDSTRVSIAFNTFPKGHIGDDSELIGLDI